MDVAGLSEKHCYKKTKPPEGGGRRTSIDRQRNDNVFIKGILIFYGYGGDLYHEDIKEECSYSPARLKHSSN